MMSSKFSSEKNQLSISTKRNFKVLWVQVWIISFFVFFVFSLKFFGGLVVMLKKYQHRSSAF